VMLKVLYSFWAGLSPRFNRYFILRHEAMKTQDLLLWHPVGSIIYLL